MKVVQKICKFQVILIIILVLIICFLISNPMEFCDHTINYYGRIHLFDKDETKVNDISETAENHQLFSKPESLITYLARGTNSTNMKIMSREKESESEKIKLFKKQTATFYKTGKSDNSINKIIHIATAANNEYIEGICGLIKTAYRKSSNPSIIQFEVFLTHDQNATLIHNMKFTKEYSDDKWSIRLHRFDQNDVDLYINHQYKYSAKKGNLTSAHNYVRYILFKRLPDVDHCLWIDADIAMHKDVIDFIMEKTRNTFEKNLLKSSRKEQQREYGLPGKSFRNNYVLGAFPRSQNLFDKSVYSHLKKLKFDVQEMPHFNAGFLLMNLDLWRRYNIDKDMLSIIRVNNELSLWTGYGSQPPLNLLLGGKKLFRLPVKAMQLNLGYQNITKPKTNVYFLHWNGEHKPWREKGFNKHLWV